MDPSRERTPTIDGGCANPLPATGPFAELQPAARERLAEAGRCVEKRLGDYLTVQGQRHRALALVLSGRVSITVHAHGDTLDLAMFGAGDVVGEMSLLDPQAASATSRVASGSAKLWIIDGAAFDRFVEQDPVSGFALIRGLARVLCQRVRGDTRCMLRRAAELRAHFLDMDY